LAVLPRELGLGSGSCGRGGCGAGRYQRRRASVTFLPQFATRMAENLRSASVHAAQR